MPTLTEEIEAYDAAQRERIQRAAVEHPETLGEEMERIHAESRQEYLEILARHNTGERKRETAHTS